MNGSYHLPEEMDSPSDRGIPFFLSSEAKTSDQSTNAYIDHVSMMTGSGKDSVLLIGENESDRARSSVEHFSRGENLQENDEPENRQTAEEIRPKYSSADSEQSLLNRLASVSAQHDNQGENGLAGLMHKVHCTNLLIEDSNASTTGAVIDSGDDFKDSLPDEMEENPNVLSALDNGMEEDNHIDTSAQYEQPLDLSEGEKASTKVLSDDSGTGEALESLIYTEEKSVEAPAGSAEVQESQRSLVGDIAEGEDLASNTIEAFPTTQSVEPSDKAIVPDDSPVKDSQIKEREGFVENNVPTPLQDEIDEPEDTREERLFSQNELQSADGAEPVESQPGTVKGLVVSFLNNSAQPTGESVADGTVVRAPTEPVLTLAVAANAIVSSEVDETTQLAEISPIGESMRLVEQLNVDDVIPSVNPVSSQNEEENRLPIVPDVSAAGDESVVIADSIALTPLTEEAIPPVVTADLMVPPAVRDHRIDEALTGLQNNLRDSDIASSPNCDYCRVTRGRDIVLQQDDTAAYKMLRDIQLAKKLSRSKKKSMKANSVDKKASPRATKASLKAPVTAAPVSKRKSSTQKAPLKESPKRARTQAEPTRKKSSQQQAKSKTAQPPKNSPKNAAKMNKDEAKPIRQPAKRKTPSDSPKEPQQKRSKK